MQHIRLEVIVRTEQGILQLVLCLLLGSIVFILIHIEHRHNILLCKAINIDGRQQVVVLRTYHQLINHQFALSLRL